ncbi:lipoprotein-34 precursor (NlpB) [Acinetobacter lanii]|uniref:Lipoprotein-34 (NlpB) n=1 Tax=Acinetobacter lanii TaxID=2715163 RepID=A0A6G8S0A0_9GAMM|nr:lipoprotein-34 precursor (NlpB) [Acinetobacter lanii]QIO07632.1 lipoprotein-34 precursor (NlpB) [Acinetobacter lanii]
MQLRFGLILALSALSLAGCSTFSKISLDNGSLDYKNTSTQEKLKYPEGAMVRPATPLYPAPVVDPLAIENAPSYVNKKGNRFDLPRPKVALEASNPIEDTASTSVGRPQLLKDGNGNPLIKIDGNAETIWQYTAATLSSLNINVVSKANQQATLKIDGETFVLKLNSAGASNTLAVFDAKNNFADKEKAAELLTQIYQNWPA